jgi:hypothetical protein
MARLGPATHVFSVAEPGKETMDGRAMQRSARPT